MSTNFNLQQEAEYVLGMMDMYHKDDEIASLLEKKGLTNKQVSEVLAFVKSEGYKKRIKQAKKILIMGFLLAVILGPLWFYLASSNDAGHGRKYNGIMVHVVLYGFVYGLAQTAYGFYRYVDYFIKLKKHKTYI